MELGGLCETTYLKARDGKLDPYEWLPDEERAAVDRLRFDGLIKFSKRGDGFNDAKVVGGLQLLSRATFDLIR